jgi:hypothetical protein
MQRLWFYDVCDPHFNHLIYSQPHSIIKNSRSSLKTSKEMDLDLHSSFIHQKSYLCMVHYFGANFSSVVPL